MPTAKTHPRDWQAKARQSWLVVCAGTAVLIIVAIAIMAIIAFISPAGYVFRR
jgi:hypothetical protein